jgi:hypothetical protein
MTPGHIVSQGSSLLSDSRVRYRPAGRLTAARGWGSCRWFLPASPCGGWANRICRKRQMTPGASLPQGRSPTAAPPGDFAVRRHDATSSAARTAARSQASGGTGRWWRSRASPVNGHPAWAATSASRPPVEPAADACPPASAGRAGRRARRRPARRPGRRRHGSGRGPRRGSRQSVPPSRPAAPARRRSPEATQPLGGCCQWCETRIGSPRLRGAFSGPCLGGL